MADSPEQQETQSIILKRGYKRLVRVVAAMQDYDNVSDYIRALIEREIGAVLSPEMIQKILADESMQEQKHPKAARKR